MDTYRLSKLSITALLAVLVFAVTNIYAVTDYVYPSTLQIQSSYTLSDTLLTVDDTLTIQRTCINNESTPLACFYFNENLHDNFSIISHTMTINRISVSYDFPTPTTSSSYTNYKSYNWVLDYPGTHGVYDHVIQPDDTVVIEYKVVCDTVGNYDLPMHTFVGHNGTSGAFGFSDSLKVQFDVALSIDDRPTLPLGFSLSQNYPNPFNPSTQIDFSIASRSFITLEIFNIIGQSVSKLIQKNLTAGNHSVKWNGKADDGYNVPSGVYFYKLQTNDRSVTKKMILLK